MAKGTPKGAKRGPYVKNSSILDHHYFIVAHSTEIPFTELAAKIDVNPDSLYNYLKRKNIPYLRVDGSKSTEQFDYASRAKKARDAKKKIIPESKPPKIVVDRSRFTNYSNPQYNLIYGT